LQKTFIKKVDKLTDEWKAEYDPRAFQQDASAAMRGDISRALIELITNSDDAYAGRDGEIIITIENGDDQFPLSISVSDRAKGLDFESMKKAFAVIGALTSQLAEGKVSRGYLGRGAKDVAIFGAAKFEAIRDGKYSDIILFKNGKGKDGAKNIPATPTHYSSIGLESGENGLKATILCQSKDAFKSVNELVKKLTTVSQLRDLIQRRKVVLHDLRKATPEIVFQNPLPQGQEVLRQKISLDGFEGEATLVIRRLHEVQSAQVTEYSAHGVLVKSGVSIFQNTWFTPSLRSRPAARWLAGEVEVPQIGIELTRELKLQIQKQEFSEVQLLSRTRDGLEKDHLLMKALASAVEKAVQRLFEEIDAVAESGQRQGEKLTNDFNLAAAAVMPDLAELLKELEDELPIADPESDISNFDLIPALVVVKPGSKVTLTLRADEDLAKSEIEISEAGPGKGLKLHGRSFSVPFKGTWADHGRLIGKVTDQVTFDVPTVKGLYSLEAVLGGETRLAQIVVADGGKKKKPAPLELEFSPKLVYSSPGRGKNLLLRAPIAFADVTVGIQANGVEVSSIPTTVTLTPEPDGAWVEANVHVKTGSKTGDLEITASAGSDVAKGTLKVEEAGSQKGKAPRLTFELNGDKDPLERYFLEKTGTGSFIVFIYGKHPLYNNVFGNYKEETKGFANEDSTQARAILSEVISHAFAQYLVELAYEKKPEDLWDAASTMFEFNRFFDKFVGKLHKALLK
jgi:hypothetical protein